MDEHFSRILPIVGDTLANKRVAVFGLQAAAPLIEYLAASGIGRWLWFADRRKHRERQLAAQLTRQLAERHGMALHADIRICTPQRKAFPSIDLVLAWGDQALLETAATFARQQQIPAVLCSHTAGEVSLRIAGIDGNYIGSQVVDDGKNTTVPSGAAAWDTICGSALVAGVARALLLRNTPYQRADLQQLWAAGRYYLRIGGQHPCDINWDTQATPPPTPPAFSTPSARRGTILIAGIGSIGSVAAAHLAPSAETLILADGDRVEPANPARQHYLLADIGKPKAVALADRVDAPAIAYPQPLHSEEQLESLLAEHAIHAALIATGTDADFLIARVFREQNIPHVVARCYPRARYWEAILVDGARGPAFEDIRGHLRLGPGAAPTAEQIAAYSDAGALEAEPATLIESGWAAAWAARLTQQLALPAGLRERWLLELLAAERTCLVGGAYVESTPQGPAYHIDLPGRIWAWGKQISIGACEHVNM
jgi:hypothetical protein